MSPRRLPGPPPPPFVGRSAELQRLAVLVERALEGGPSLAILSGEPGIGKTSILREVDALARRRKIGVVWGRAWELGGAPPYWPWSQVLAGLATPLSTDAPSLPHVLDAPPVGAADEHRPFRVQAQIVSTVCGVARRRPLVVALDDLHAMDLESIRTLLLFARSLQDERMLLVATMRTVERHTTPEQDGLLATVCRHAVTLPIAGLSVNELEALVAGSVDATHSGEVALRLHTRTNGNPLFARELLAFSSAADAPAPGDLRESLLARVQGLDESSSRILGALAVVGMDATLESVQVVSEATVDEVEAAVRVAEALGVLRRVDDTRVQFVHSLFAEVLEAQLLPSIRADMHERAGESLSAGVASPPIEDIARHFVAVARVRREPRARQYVLRAAEGAERAAAYGSAADLYALARSLPFEATSAKAEGLELSHARSALLAGRRSKARGIYAEAFAAARTAADAERTVLSALGFARTSAYGTLDDEAVTKLEVALALAPASGDVVLRSRVLGSLAVALWATDAHGRRDALSAEAVDLARDSNSPRCLVEALAARSNALWSPRFIAERRALAEELQARTSEIDDASLRFEASRWWMNVAWESGDGAGGDAALEAYEAAARRVGSAQAAMNVALRRATRAQIRGELEAVDRFIATLRLEGQRAEDPQTELYAAFGALYPLLLRGHLDDVRALLPELKRGAEVWRATAAPSTLPALAYLALDRPREALAWAETCGGGAAAIEWGQPHRLGMLADITIALGDRARAEEVEASLAPFVEQYMWSGIGHPSGPVALALARLDELLERTTSATDRLEAARAVASRMGDAPRLAAIERSLKISSQPRSRPASTIGRRATGAQVRATPGTIVREGSVWTIDFRGKTVRIKSVKGLEYVARLVGRAGEDVHALELVSDGRGTVDGGGLGPVIDQRAKRAYMTKLASLREAVEEAERLGHDARRDRARAEMEALEDQLARAFGLGGRAREEGSSAERARLAVAKAIRRARELIAREHPELALHLENAIRTGIFCSYRPESDSYLTTAE